MSVFRPGRNYCVSKGAIYIVKIINRTKLGWWGSFIPKVKCLFPKRQKVRTPGGVLFNPAQVGRSPEQLFFPYSRTKSKKKLRNKANILECPIFVPKNVMAQACKALGKAKSSLGNFFL